MEPGTGLEFNNKMDGNNFHTTKFIIIKASPSISDILPYLFIFVVYAVMVQVGLALWKRFHLRTYKIFILSSITVTMPFICIIFNNKVGLLIYFLFICLMVYLSKSVLQFRTKKTAPGTVFKAFKLVFLITNHTAIASQVTLVISYFLGTGTLLITLKVFFNCVYYAVLSREIVKNLCFAMAKNTGYYSEEGVPGNKESTDLCMICTNSLNNTAPANNNTVGEKIITLRCGHKFHEDCIKGWCVIGQSSSCYYCKEGVEDKIFNQDYWLKSELFIRPVMNSLRSLISFSIVLIAVYYFKSSREPQQRSNKFY